MCKRRAELLIAASLWLSMLIDSHTVSSALQLAIAHLLNIVGFSQWIGEGGGALCICRVFDLQMISETQHTLMVTHFMSTVHAHNFCSMDLTIWQCFESEFAFHKSFLNLLSLSLFSQPCPASSSDDSFSYSSALWIKTTGATDGCKSGRRYIYIYIYTVERLKSDSWRHDIIIVITGILLTCTTSCGAS